MKGSKAWSVVLFILVLVFLVFCLRWYGKQNKSETRENNEALLEIQERTEVPTLAATERTGGTEGVPTAEPEGQAVPEVTADIEARLSEMEAPLSRLLRLVFFDVIPEKGAMVALEEVAPYLSEACREYYKGYIGCILYENDLPDFYPEEEGDYVWLWDEDGTQVTGVLPLGEYEIQYGEAIQADIFTVDPPRKEDEISLTYSVLDGNQILVSAMDEKRGERTEFRIMLNTEGIIEVIYMYGGGSDE